MHKGFLKAGAIIGAIGIAIGAFGAHGLKKVLPHDALVVYETGARYQMYHAFALLATAILYKEINTPAIIWAGRCFITGTILFSGSLYVLALLWPNFGILGMITPIGGTCFIFGWLLLAYAASQKLK